MNEDSVEEPGWTLLIDPTWEPTGDEDPPPEMVLGGWERHADGSTGKFQANPGYRPANEESPTDPVDAVLRDVAREGHGADDLLPVLDDAVVEVALDDDGLALVEPAPDGMPSVLVATAPAHRHRVGAADWLGTTVREIVSLLPDSGIDVLLNPGGPASIRLDTPVLRKRLAEPA